MQVARLTSQRVKVKTIQHKPARILDIINMNLLRITLDDPNCTLVSNKGQLDLRPRHQNLT